MGCTNGLIVKILHEISEMWSDICSARKALLYMGPVDPPVPTAPNDWLVRHS